MEKPYNLGRKNRFHQDRIGTVNIGANYSEEEVEFLKAIDRLKRETGTNFPTNTQIFRLLLSLGYRKVTVDQDGTEDQSNQPSSPGDEVPQGGNEDHRR